MLQQSELNIQNLQDVFSTFNKVSSDLQKSYQDLESQVSSLNNELSTARSARLKDLRAKEELATRLTALMNALPGGIVIINSRNIVIEENQAARNILHHSYLNKTWSFCKQGQVFNGEFALHNDRYIAVSSSPYGDAGDHILLVTDTTCNVQLNRQINRDKRLKAMGEMAARLAHQIRTPLATAILYITSLNSRARDITEPRQYIDKIHGKLGHIEKLVTGMLQYLNEGITSSDQFSLDDMLQDITATFSDRIERDSRLTYHSSVTDSVITGNRIALDNAVSNLVENAIAAVPAKAIISISLEKNQSNFLVVVEDNGPGIDDELRDQVFDPFFSTHSQGTGLGLAVVLSVIKAHAGDIQISRSSQGGAKFIITLPDNPVLSSGNSGLWESGQSSSALQAKENIHE